MAERSSPERNFAFCCELVAFGAMVGMANYGLFKTEAPKAMPHTFVGEG